MCITLGRLGVAGETQGSVEAGDVFLGGGEETLDFFKPKLQIKARCPIWVPGEYC